jgi:type IV pilus assembly protein PilP
MPVFAQTNQRLREVFKSMTAIENPFELRDPFKAPLPTGSAADTREQKSLTRDGIYTNIDQIEIVDISQLRIVGVMSGRERRALARLKGGAKNDIIVLREGMRIGADNAELKAIHPGGVILVEKLVNVYGEEEFLETVIPISK